MMAECAMQIIGSPSSIARGSITHLKIAWVNNAKARCRKTS
jgi:hypothetical protein